MFVLFLVALILFRSPDDGAEREFQDVFQANLSAEEQERIEEYQTQAAGYETRGSFSLALEQYRKILVLNETHQGALAESARLERIGLIEGADLNAFLIVEDRQIDGTRQVVLGEFRGRPDVDDLGEFTEIMRERDGFDMFHGFMAKRCWR